jgi:hypothetical protein
MTPEQLVDVREIEQLKYRYMRAVDTRDWELLAATLHPEVSAAYGKRLSFDDRVELVSTLRAFMGPETITVHRLHHPEIEVDGDSATGTWLLTDRVIRKKDRVMIQGAAFYGDEYRREPDGWVISKTGYERIYESETSLDDLPSFSLTADLFEDR